VQILLALRDSPGLTPSSLADSLGMSRSSMSHALARFDAAGLIDRSVDDTDRRSMRLGLSPRGWARMRAFEEALESVLVARAEEVRTGTTLLGFPAGAEHRSGLSALEAGAQLGRVGVAYVEDVDEVLGPLGPLEWRERFVLTLVHRHGELRPATLAGALRMSSSGTSTLLDRLESIGLIQRRQGPDVGDRRAVVVSFTPKGAKLAEASLDVLERHAEDVAGALTAALIHPAQDGAPRPLQE
jgi:DNA-binding MarR family transcriptional regulator